MTDFDPIPCWHQMLTEYGDPLPHSPPDTGVCATVGCPQPVRAGTRFCTACVPMIVESPPALPSASIHSSAPEEVSQ
jgi:hypothetical protein